MNKKICDAIQLKSWHILNCKGLLLQGEWQQNIKTKTKQNYQTIDLRNHQCWDF